jgi:hypothetical protein
MQQQAGYGLIMAERRVRPPLNRRSLGEGSR